jgi:hypothetical protein
MDMVVGEWMVDVLAKLVDAFYNDCMVTMCMQSS